MYHHQQQQACFVIVLYLFVNVYCSTKRKVLIAATVAVRLFLCMSAQIVGGRQFNQFWLSFTASLII